MMVDMIDITSLKISGDDKEFENMESDQNEAKSLSKKKTTLTLNRKEFEGLSQGINNLSALIRSKDFKLWLRTKTSSDKEVGEFYQAMHAIVNVLSKEQRPKKVQSESAKKNSFFTKEWERTDSLNTLEILCDTKLETVSITTVRSLLTAYIKSNDLMGEDKSITIDDNIYSISPESFDESKRFYSAAEWKSVSLTFAKNVLHWKPSS